MSALITRASMSSVTPGSVAARAPFSVARFRAAVCESDWTVGASSTSATAIASATVSGGSAACEARSDITVRTASAPTSAASPRSSSPMFCVAGLQTTTNLLAVLHGEAIPHHRADGRIQIAHSTQPSYCASSAEDRGRATAIGDADIHARPRKQKPDAGAASSLLQPDSCRRAPR